MHEYVQTLLAGGLSVVSVFVTLWITGRREERREDARIWNEADARLLPARLELFERYLDVSKFHVNLIRQSLLPNIDPREFSASEIVAWEKVARLRTKLELIAPRLRANVSHYESLREEWVKDRDTSPFEGARIVLADEISDSVDTIAWNMSAQLRALGKPKQYFASQGLRIERRSLWSRVQPRLSRAQTR